MNREHLFRNFVFFVVLAVFGLACVPEHAVNPEGSRQQGESCTQAQDCAEGLLCAGGYCVAVDVDAGIVDAFNTDLLHSDRGASDFGIIDLGSSDQETPDHALNADSASVDSDMQDHPSVIDAGISDRGADDLASMDSALMSDATVQNDLGQQNDANAQEASVSECSLSLDPADVALGEVIVGSARSFSLVVHAEQGPCVIESVLQSPESADLALVEPQDWPQELQAGQDLALVFVYSPVDVATLNTQIQLQVAQLVDGPTAQIHATAVQQDEINCLHFVQSAIDFGQVPLACPMTADILLRNDCYFQRTVDDVSIVGDASFSVINGTSFDIAGHSSRYVSVQILAENEGVKTALLRAVQHSGDDVGGVVSLFADVVTDGMVSDLFVQGGTGPVDLVIVVDDSGSMQDFQDQLAEQISAVTNIWSQLGVDFHIGVTTTDMSEGYPVVGGGGPRGRFIPLDDDDPVLSSTSENLDARLRQAVQAGTDGDGNERGLDALRAALSPDLLSDRNAGFLRPNAQLSVLFLSDEDDSSDVSPANLAAHLRDIKAALGSNAISAGAVVGPRPNGCNDTDLGVFADAGLRYLDFVEDVSGRTMNICQADWRNQLQIFAQVAAGRREVFFARNDVNTRPDVYVDNEIQTRNQDYQWNSRLNAIIFVESSLPNSGQVVELRYTPVCQ